MSDAWVPLLFASLAAAGAGWYFLGRCSAKPLDFADEREERLVRKMAKDVGCSLAQALPAVRHELDLAPNQPDETLVKRAAYHYRQDLPAPTCQVYRDRAPG